ncbi:MAG: apolipoprotein N-acyltransferase [Candidatus Omnitrophota bacterium]
MKNRFVKISLAVLSGALSFLAFPPYELTFLGWVCLVPFFLVFKSQNSFKESFFYGFLSGIVFFSGLLYWLVNVTVPGMIVLVIFLSLFFGVFGICTRFVFKLSMDFLILPFVWVILEFTRGFLFTGFPWGYLGYTQYQNLNLIQIADFTGVYGVSFLLVIFNAAIAALFLRAKKRVTYMAVALIFVIMSISYSIYKFNNYYVENGLRVSVVQGNIPQQLKWDSAYAEEIINKYMDLTEKTIEANPNLIIWPETSYPYLLEQVNDVSEISEFTKKNKTSLLLGVVRKENDDYFNSAMLFDKEGGIAGIYRKTHLVPFGEYIPFKKSFSFLRDYIDKPIGDFSHGDNYNIFSVKSIRLGSTDQAKTRMTKFYKFGVLICFEDIFPYITRNLVKQGAEFVVNITNDAWFGKTAAARQHLQASVFRAIENRVPLIRAANTGVSGFIDSTGEILKTVNEDGSEIFVSGIATHDITTHIGRSYYTLYGDVFVFFSMGALLCLLIVEKMAKKDER